MEREKRVEMGKLIERKNRREKETKGEMVYGSNGGRSWLDYQQRSG